MGVYLMFVIFQTTMCVAGERERHTLDFLLLLPAERRDVLFYKWLGPIWKNWPILAIAYLGLLLAAGTLGYAVERPGRFCFSPDPFCSCAAASDC